MFYEGGSVVDDVEIYGEMVSEIGQYDVINSALIQRASSSSKSAATRAHTHNRIESLLLRSSRTVLLDDPFCDGSKSIIFRLPYLGVCVSGSDNDMGRESLLNRVVCVPKIILEKVHSLPNQSAN